MMVPVSEKEPFISDLNVTGTCTYANSFDATSQPIADNVHQIAEYKVLQSFLFSH